MCGTNGRELLSRNTSFIPNSDRLPEKMANFGSTLHQPKLYENIKLKKKNVMRKIIKRQLNSHETIILNLKNITTIMVGICPTLSEDGIGQQ
jgi:hypothetical protein